MTARRFSISFVATLLTLVLTACGGDEAPTSTAPIDATYAPKPSPDAALEAMLAAEQRQDRNASFALLEPGARKDYPRVENWVTRRNELGAITKYDVLEGEGDDGKAVAIVEHEPTLDLFKGLVPAKEKQTWTGVKVEGGWLLQPEPLFEPEYPADSAAPAVVRSWVEAVQACDQARAESLQAVKDLYTTGGPTVCRAAGPVEVGEAERLRDGPVTSMIVDAYSSDANEWARSVMVTSPAQFTVIVAPIGSEWKVIGFTYA